MKELLLDLVEWLFPIRVMYRREPPVIIDAATIERPRASTIGPTLKDIRAGRASVPEWNPEHSLLPPEHWPARWKL